MLLSKNGVTLGRWRQPFIFALVGCINTLIDITTFMILTHGLSWNANAANVASFCLGALNSYVLNAKITFKSYEKKLSFARTIGKFTTVTVCSLGISAFTLWTFLQLGIGNLPAKFGSVIATFSFAFVAQKWFVFRVQK